MYHRKCMDPLKCAQRAPLGPPENKCCCKSSSQINSLLNQSEYEVGKEKKKSRKKSKQIRENANYSEFEFADDAISLNDSFEERPSSRNSNTSHTTENPYINVNGKEELPCVEEMRKYCISENISVTSDNTKTESKIVVKNQNNVNERIKLNKDLDGNYNKLTVKNIYSYCTLPKTKKFALNHKHFWIRHLVPPKRVTPDGTHIYYWCDLHKKGHYGKIYFFIVFIVARF